MVVRSRPSHKSDFSFSSFGSVISDIYSMAGLDDDSESEDNQSRAGDDHVVSILSFADLRQDGENASVSIQPLRQRLGASSSILAATTSDFEEFNPPLTPPTPPGSSTPSERRELDQCNTLSSAWSPSPLQTILYDDVSPESSVASICSTTSLTKTTVSSLIESLDHMCATEKLEKNGAGDKTQLSFLADPSRPKPPHQRSNSSSLNPVELFSSKMDSITEEYIDKSEGKTGGLEGFRPTLKARISPRKQTTVYQRKQVPKVSHRQSFKPSGEVTMKNTTSGSSAQKVYIFVDSDNEANRRNSTPRTKRFGEHGDKENIEPKQKTLMYSHQGKNDSHPKAGPDQGKLKLGHLSQETVDKRKFSQPNTSSIKVSREGGTTKSGKENSMMIAKDNSTFKLPTLETQITSKATSHKRNVRNPIKQNDKGKSGKHRTKLAPFRERNLNVL